MFSLRLGVNQNFNVPPPAAPSLNVLSLSATAFVVGTASNGVITGATAGSAIALTNGPSGLTINSAARTWAWSGSGSAASGNLTLTETLAGAANSPRATVLAYSVQAAAPPPPNTPVLNFQVDTATGATTASVSAVTTGTDGTLYVVFTSTNTAPSKAQIKNGLNASGVSVPSTSGAVASPGQRTLTKGGLTPSTQYYTHFMHESAGGLQSEVVTADGFTTSAAIAGPAMLFTNDSNGSAFEIEGRPSIGYTGYIARYLSDNFPAYDMWQCGQPGQSLGYPSQLGQNTEGVNGTQPNTIWGRLHQIRDAAPQRVHIADFGNTMAEMYTNDGGARTPAQYASEYTTRLTAIIDWMKANIPSLNGGNIYYKLITPAPASFYNGDGSHWKYNLTRTAVNNWARGAVGTVLAGYNPVGDHPIYGTDTAPINFPSTGVAPNIIPNNDVHWSDVQKTAANQVSAAWFRGVMGETTATALTAGDWFGPDTGNLAPGSVLTFDYMISGLANNVAVPMAVSGAGGQIARGTSAPGTSTINLINGQVARVTATVGASGSRVITVSSGAASDTVTVSAAAVATLASFSTTIKLAEAVITESNRRLAVPTGHGGARVAQVPTAKWFLAFKVNGVGTQVQVGVSNSSYDAALTAGSASAHSNVAQGQGLCVQGQNNGNAIVVPQSAPAHPFHLWEAVPANTQKPKNGEYIVLAGDPANNRFALGLIPLNTGGTSYDPVKWVKADSTAFPNPYVVDFGTGAGMYSMTMDEQHIFATAVGGDLTIVSDTVTEAARPAGYAVLGS